MHLKKEFFLQDTIKVAKLLLGKFLVHKIEEKTLIGKIIETEAYLGAKDKASHSYNFKKTQRNKAEYLAGGHIYIYLVYGMYWQLNITTGADDVPECVLIRAIEPISGIEEMIKRRGTNNLTNLTNGPGKLCQAMGFNKNLYGIDLCKSSFIYIEDKKKLPESKIIKAKRIGIDYAGIWKDRLLRFYIK